MFILYKYTLRPEKLKSQECSVLRKKSIFFFFYLVPFFFLPAMRRPVGLLAEKAPSSAAASDTN